MRRKVHGRDEFLPYGLPVSGSWLEGGGGVKTPPYGAKDKGVAMARLRAGHARPLRNVIKWDVGRPAHRPPGTLAAARKPAGCRCRGRRPRRPAEGQGFSLQNEPRKGHVGRPAHRPPRTLAAARRCTGGMNPSPTDGPLAGVCREAAEGSRPLPTMQKINGWQWQGCGPGMPGPYGI